MKLKLTNNETVNFFLKAYIAEVLGFLSIASLGGAFASLIKFTQKTTKTTTGIFFKKTITEHHSFSERLPYLISAITLVVIAIYLFKTAAKMFVIQNRYKKYEAIIKGTERISIQDLSDITGNTRKNVVTDLQNMIDSEIISDYYIDHKSDAVISKKFIPETSTRKVVRCDNCSAANEIIVGIPKNCEYCGTPLNVN